MDKTNTKSLKSQLTQKSKTANFSFLAYCARVKSSCLGYLLGICNFDHYYCLTIHSHKGCVYALLYHTFRTLEKYIRMKVKEIFNVYACPHLIWNSSASISKSRNISWIRFWIKSGVKSGFPPIRHLNHHLIWYQIRNQIRNQIQGQTCCQIRNQTLSQIQKQIQNLNPDPDPDYIRRVRSGENLIWHLIHDLESNPNWKSSIKQ